MAPTKIVSPSSPSGLRNQHLSPNRGLTTPAMAVPPSGLEKCSFKTNASGFEFESSDLTDTSYVALRMRKHASNMGAFSQGRDQLLNVDASSFSAWPNQLQR